MPDYRVRPAKHVQRLMVAEALQRLRSFTKLSDYLYVGFGAIYFVDFVLLHRSLDITRMISIEGDKKLLPRVEFNRPFDSVETVAGYSWEHFKTLPFDGPAIVWADYTGQLNNQILGDVDTLSLRLQPGSIFLITVNVDADKVDNPPAGRLALLEERMGAAAVPLGTTDADLDGWDKARVLRRAVHNQVEASIATRGDGVAYQQLFHFQYRDSARMLTVGGLLTHADLGDAVERCGWDELFYLRFDDEPFRIDLPTLTMKELAHLDAQLPQDFSDVKGVGLSDKEVKAYAEVYRYYPRYALVDV